MNQCRIRAGDFPVFNFVIDSTGDRTRCDLANVGAGKRIGKFHDVVFPRFC